MLWLLDNRVEDRLRDLPVSLSVFSCLAADAASSTSLCKRSRRSLQVSEAFTLLRVHTLQQLGTSLNAAHQPAPVWMERR